MRRFGKVRDLVEQKVKRQAVDALKTELNKAYQVKINPDALKILEREQSDREN